MNRLNRLIAILAMGSTTLGLAACAGENTPSVSGETTKVEYYTVDDSGRQLGIAVESQMNGEHPKIEVAENSDTVTLTVTLPALEAGAVDNREVGVWDVKLKEPLGTRKVMDSATGAQVTFIE